MDMQASEEGSDDDDDDDDDEAGGAKRAVAKAKAATMSADKSRIAIKRKFKATLRANVGDEEGSGSDGDGGDEGNDPSYDPFEEEKEEDEKGVVIARKVKKDGSPDKRVKSDEDRKTRRRNMRPDDLEGREVTVSPQGKPTRKRVNWTFDEEQSLIEGIKVYRTEFARILEDPRFRVMLSRRTNVDLKDKYRTMRKRGTVKDMGDRPEGWRKEMGRAYAGSKKTKKRVGDKEEEEEEEKKLAGLLHRLHAYTVININNNKDIWLAHHGPPFAAQPLLPEPSVVLLV